MKIAFGRLCCHVACVSDVTSTDTDTPQNALEQGEMWWWSLLALGLIFLVWYAHLVRGEYLRERHDIPQLPKNLSLETLKLKLPKDFLWGTATASHQVEGYTTNNQWTAYEEVIKEDGNPVCKDRCGRASDHWNLFEEDLEHMTKLGVNCYRFSLEWSRIQPTADHFDDEAMARYVFWCKKLKSRDMF